MIAFKDGFKSSNLKVKSFNSDEDCLNDSFTFSNLKVKCFNFDADCKVLPPQAFPHPLLLRRPACIRTPSEF